MHRGGNHVTAREADIFRCFVDTVVAPVAPPIGGTDAVDFLDDFLTQSPALNRLGMRAMLYALELAPLATGAGARLRRLPAEERRAVLSRIAGTPLVGALDALRAVAQLAYYGDDAVMRGLGYDADAVASSAHALRVAEARW
jgi:hypothetical protein